MGDYVVTHFRDEEALQVKYNYPGYADHKKAHQAFMKDVAEMTEDLNKNGITAASRSMIGLTLTSWLTLHIRREDKAVGAFIRG